MVQLSQAPRAVFDVATHPETELIIYCAYHICKSSAHIICANQRMYGLEKARLAVSIESPFLYMTVLIANTSCLCLCHYLLFGQVMSLHHSNHC